MCLMFHLYKVYSGVEHPAWWQMINFDVKFNFKNYVLGPENLWLCCPANQKCMIWSYDCGARVDMSTLTPGREAGSRGSVKWVRCGMWDEARGQIDSDLTVVWGPSIAGIPCLKETFHHSHESLCHPIFWELSSENDFQKLQKSLKLVHLLKIVSLETRLRWSQMGIRRVQRAILSNGPHLGSLQWG